MSPLFQLAAEEGVQYDSAERISPPHRARSGFAMIWIPADSFTKWTDPSAKT